MWILWRTKNIRIHFEWIVASLLCLAEEKFEVEKSEPVLWKKKKIESKDIFIFICLIEFHQSRIYVVIREYFLKCFLILKLSRRSMKQPAAEKMTQFLEEFEIRFFSASCLVWSLPQPPPLLCSVSRIHKKKPKIRPIDIYGGSFNRCGFRVALWHLFGIVFHCRFLLEFVWSVLDLLRSSRVQSIAWPEKGNSNTFFRSLSSHFRCWYSSIVIRHTSFFSVFIRSEVKNM